MVDPFPSTLPSKLTADPSLQTHLMEAISQIQGGNALRASIGLCSINNTSLAPTYRYAGFKDTEMHYSASLLKVAAMYSAFQIKKSINRFAEVTPVPVFPLFLAQVAAIFDPKILLAIPSLASDPEIHTSPLATQASIFRLKYESLFDVSADRALVSFKPAFLSRLRGAIVNSSNSDAATVVKSLGYKWLNGSLEGAGFLSMGPPVSGIWLGGTFESGLQNSWPAARVDTVNDQGVGQAMTCLGMMKLYAAMDSRELVDSPSSDEMLQLLSDAQISGPDPSFLTRSDVLGGIRVAFDVTHCKIGLGPLKSRNGGFEVASEGAFIRHRESSRRFILVYQNCQNLTSELRALSRIVDKTIGLHLSHT